MSFTTVTVTGYSPFWSNVLTIPNGATNGYSMIAGEDRAKVAKAISKLMRGGGTRDARAVFNALIGAASGGTASATFKRVGNPNSVETSVPGVTSIGDFGGNRDIDTITAINRATTAADVTELKKWVANTALLEAGITYPSVVGNNVATGNLVNGVTRF